MHEAIYLSGLAKKVYLIHRRDEFRGGIDLVEKAKARKNIEIVLNATIESLHGDNKLESITIKQGSTEKTIKLDGLFVSIGREPKAKNLMPELDLDDGGFIEANESCVTNVDGIFVAGDVRSKDVRQLVTATGDGAIAATAALHYLEKA